MSDCKRYPWFIWCATVGGLGLLPKAPGTWGSLSGIALGFALAVSPWSYLLRVLLLLLFALFAWWIILLAEAYWEHDDKRIVIDETIGQALVLAWLPVTPVTVLLGFALFRLFDIWKPWLVGYFDRHWHSALGTLLDDVIAGVFALVTLYLLQLTFSYLA